MNNFPTEKRHSFNHDLQKKLRLTCRDPMQSFIYGFTIIQFVSFEVVTLVNIKHSKDSNSQSIEKSYKSGLQKYINIKMNLFK